jgi:hypothetical protein
MNMSNEDYRRDMLAHHYDAEMGQYVFADKRYYLHGAQWVIWAVVGIVAILALFVLLTPRHAAASEDINMAIISKIESNHNPAAYNQLSGARGEYQITPVCAREIKAAGIEDVYGSTGAAWYMNTRIPAMLRALRLPDTKENRLIAYNAGIGILKAYTQGKRGLKKETQDYIAKYRRLEGR